MGKITINEIHKSLFGYIQAVSDESLETKDKTIVGAINELIQNSNSNKTEINNLTNEISNGKQLIANAIGEPLTAEDSFTEMSTDINGLLSTFKANMMNNGVTVESGDKFKQLIDKIKGLTEGEGNKGIQFAMGEGNWTVSASNWGVSNEITIETNIGFIPSYIICKLSQVSVYFSNGSSSQGLNTNNVFLSNLSPIDETIFDKYMSYGIPNSNIFIKNITENSFVLAETCTNVSGATSKMSGTLTEWYAIGVGEEDTTLRDSLASILQDEGVEVTPEDDMADLIVKVDEEFDRKNANSGLDIISATTLPATGKENQICVITDNPNTILMTTDISDISSLSTNTIGCLIKEGKPSNVTEGGLLQITGNNLTYSIYMKYFIQNGSYIPSYIYKNVNWEEFTKRQINFIKDGYYVSPNPFGTFVTSFTSSNSKRYLKYNAGKGVVTYYNAGSGYYYMWNTLSNQINFEGYNTIRITAYAKQLSSWTANPMVKFYTTTVSGVASSESKTYFTHPSYVDSVDFQSIPFHTPTDLYFDISSWTGEKYLAMMCYVEEDSLVTGNHIIITDISFM